MRRALAGAPVSPDSPLGFCGQKPRWAAAWGAAFLLMQSVSGSATAGDWVRAAASRLRPKSIC